MSLRIEPRAKVSRVAGLLENAPIPPKVRAGLMRALSNQPGVRAIGHDTDPLGRRGVALAADDSAVTVTAEYGAPKAEQGTYRSRAVIIFDGHTGALLSVQEELTRPGGPYAEMKPGFVIHYGAVPILAYNFPFPWRRIETPGECAIQSSVGGTNLRLAARSG